MLITLIITIVVAILIGKVEFKEIKIPTIYDSESVAGSHYRPITDTFKFTMMNTKLFFASIFLICKRE